MLDQNEIELFRDNVKKFLENEVAPHYDQWEKAEMFPRELWNKMGENGLLCVDVPEEYGGFGANFRLSAVIVEEASRAGFGAGVQHLRALRHRCSLHPSPGQRRAEASLVAENGDR